MDENDYISDHTEQSWESDGSCIADAEEDELDLSFVEAESVSQSERAGDILGALEFLKQSNVVIQ